jgi:folate-binding protein YgfZ
MTDSLHSFEGHGLPAVLDLARSVVSGPIQDTEALGRGPRLFDISDLDRVRVTGRDRIRFLHAMLSNDMARLSPGEGRWATLNTIAGKTVSDVRVFVLDDDKREGVALALVEPGAGPSFVKALEHYIIADKCNFAEDPGNTLLLLCGPGAEGVLIAAGAELPAAGLYRHVTTELGGVAVRILRLDRTGQNGGDLGLYFATASEAAVRAALSGVEDGSPELLEALRIEGGQPRFGIDFSQDNIPLEAGLKNLAISFTKGCYVGQEVICRIDTLGKPKRRLVRIEGLKGAAPAPGTLLFATGKEVGFTTSAVVTTSGTLAFGYVGKRYNEPGAEIQLGAVDGATVRVGAEIGSG